MKKIEIHKQSFFLHPSGGVFWEATQTWLLADVHLGKVAHFRKNGIAVPREAEGAFYQKIGSLLHLKPPKRILFLGDLFHSFQNNEWHLFEAWTQKQEAQLVLVEGNHDVIPSLKFKQLGMKVVEQLCEDPFCFSHFPSEKTTHFVFCGHVHPGIKLKGTAKQTLKLPCFLHSTHQFILPAFGGFTGLHLVKPTSLDQIYITTGKEVIEIPVNKS